MTLNSTTTLLLLTSMARENIPENVTAAAFPQLVNTTFVIEIIRSVHNVYVFKNFIFYITEKLNIESDTASQFFENFWDTFPLVPSIIISNDYTNKYYMDGLISTPALVLIFTTATDDPIMELAAESLTGVRVLKTIFVLFPIMETDDYNDSWENYQIYGNIISTTYEWIWKKQFLNTMLLSIKNNVYLLNPYPTLRVLNKTNRWNVNDFFIDRSQNMKGYLIDTPIRYDLPRIFQKLHIHDKKHRDIITVSGTSGMLFTVFIESINATLNDTSMATPISDNDPVDLNKVLDYIAEKSLEISLHSYTAIVPKLDAGQSYPIGINDWCIMVPYRNRSPEHIYLLKVFQYSTWILLCCSIMYISLIIWLCSPDRPRDYSASLLQAICSLVSIAPIAIIRAPVVPMRFLYFALFVYGFIISNMYTSKITSYLTTSLSQQQINTVQDVIAANLRIKLYDYEYEKLESMPAHYPKRFLEQLDIVDKHFLDTHRDHMNTSYGYSIQSDRWQFLNIQQRFLRKPLFRLSKICIGPFYHVFPMQIDSHLQMPLKYFIMYASQSGFLEHWEQSAFAEALRLKYVRMLKVSENLKPLSLRFFRPVWYVWWFGLVMSGVVLIIEMKWLDMAVIRRKVNEFLGWVRGEYW